MQSFQKIDPEQIIDNPFHLIGKDWMLVTAQKRGSDSYNTMTASWGGVGILWNKPVAFVFVRPQRYTMEFLMQSDTLSLSFFDEDWRDALRLCGSKSGRDVDKAALTGLSPVSLGGCTFFEQARLVLHCRFLYADDLKEPCFIVPDLLDNYQNKDYHRMFICEITEVLKKVPD